MKVKNYITSLTLIFLCSTVGYGQTDIEIPPKVTEVLEYLQSKEATKAKGEVHKVRLVNWKIFDIDENGVDEIFLQTVPHYAMSPTISIFQRSKDGTISKMLEGFAPGKLVAITAEDRFLDTHEMGIAKDIPLSASQPQRFKNLADSAYLHGIAVVLFKNFAHTDSRKGLTSLIDLTYLETDRTHCGDFKFPQPDQLAVGKMAGEKNNYLVAKVDDQLYCYEIKRFSRRGFIEKTIKVVPLPDDFLQLEVEKDKIMYRTKNDKTRPLKL